MKKQLLYIITALILIVKTASAQSAGYLDSTFNSHGYYTYDFGNSDNFNDIKVQPNDQKIVCTGVSLDSTYVGTAKILRFNTDGTPDSTFAGNGVFSFSITTDTYGYESYVRSDGKIVVAGLAAVTFGDYDILLFRLNSNGTLDSTFGTNGSTVKSFSVQNDLAQAMTVQGDGKILVSGTILDTVTFFNVPSIIRFTENGFVDSTFGTNGVVQIPVVATDNELTSIAVQSDESIVAAGHYSNPFIGFDNFDILVVRVNSDGVLDPSFGNGGIVITPINGGVDDSFGMQLNEKGIIVCGFTTLPVTLSLDMVLLQYNSVGTLDSTFGTDGIVDFNAFGEDVGYDLKIQSDNKIVVGGTSGDPLLGPRPMAVWRYLPTGIIDSTFGINGIITTSINPLYQDINSIALQQDGKIVAAGKTHNGSSTDIAVLRYMNDLVNKVNEINMDDEMFVSPNPISRGSLLNIKSAQKKSSQVRVELFDVMGRKVAMFNPGLQNSGENIFQISIPESIQSGLYFLVLSDDKNLRKQKIIVQ